MDLKVMCYYVFFSKIKSSDYICFYTKCNIYSIKLEINMKLLS